MRKKIRRLLCAASALFPITSLIAQPNIAFLSISDIHLNCNQPHPMSIDPCCQSQRNDMDLKTLKRLLSLIKAETTTTGVIAKPAFILYLGDMVGHKKWQLTDREAYVKTDITKIFDLLSTYFPNTPIINIFGNNDSVQEDYGDYDDTGDSPSTIAINSHFNNAFLSSGILCHKTQKQQKMPCLMSQNTHLGCFSIRLADQLILIGLNSVMFSRYHHADANAAAQQIQFLADALKKAKNEHDSVLIAMHIPIGNNTYNNKPFWQMAPQKAFLQILLKYRNEIKGLLVAHTHKEEFKVLRLGDQNIGEYFTAALSTSHGNSPSVKSFDLVKDQNHWVIGNYTTYQIHDAHGKPHLTKYYDFNALYCHAEGKIHDINLCLKSVSFKDILARLNVNNPNNQPYARFPETFYVAP